MNTDADLPIFLQPSSGRSQTRHSYRERIALLNAPALKAVLLAIQSTATVPVLCFNLFDDLELRLQTEALEPLGHDGFIWHGTLHGVQDVRGYLAVSGLSNAESVVASGSVLYGRESFTISCLEAGHVRIAEENMAAMTCGGAALVPDEIEEMNYVALGLGPQGGGGVGKDVLIHVLALYPAECKKSFKGGEQGIKITMAAAQAWANDAFHNSGIPAKVQITTQESSTIHRHGVARLFDEVISDPHGEAWKGVSLAREKAQASIVVLLTDLLVDESGSILAGQASAIPEPPQSNLSGLQYATIAMTLSSEYSAGSLFAHELGHLLGGKHDRLTQPGRFDGSPAYDYVRGYVPEDLSFVTVLGYPRGNIHYVPAYSAADQQWKGKPLGIAAGHRDAADAAHFFRLSTRTVASYREYKPHSDMVKVAFTVSPKLGGLVTPGALGPYAKNSIIKFVATPRAGYKFSRWVLDQETLPGSEPIIEVKADKLHALVAEFVGGEEFCSLSIVQPAQAPHWKIVVYRLDENDDYTGTTFFPGEEITLVLVGPIPDYKIEHWVVDGHLAGTERRLVLRMDRDRRVEVRLRNSDKFIKKIFFDTQDLMSKSRIHFRAEVFDEKEMGVPDVPVTIILKKAPSGTHLIGDGHFKTDAHGQVTAEIQAGSDSGVVQVEVRVDHGGVPSITRSVQIPKYVLQPVSPSWASLPLYASENSVRIDVKLTERGRGAAAGKNVWFELEGVPPTGTRLTPTVAETDARGIASAVLDYHAGSPPESVTVSKYDDALAVRQLTYQPCVYSGRKVERQGGNGLKMQHASVGHVLPPLKVRVWDTTASGERPSVGTVVKYTLASGTTGIALESDTAMTDGNGDAEVRLTAAKGVGVATVVAQVTHSTSAIELATFSIHVVSGEFLLHPVSGDKQVLRIGQAPGPLTVEVLHNGQPLHGAWIYPFVQKGLASLSLLSSTECISTDDHGRAEIKFAGQAMAAGKMQIGIRTDFTKPLFVHIEVV